MPGERGPPIPTEQKGQWAPEPVWTLGRREQSLLLARISNPRSSSPLLSHYTDYTILATIITNMSWRLNAKWLTKRRPQFTTNWWEQWETLQWFSAHSSRFVSEENPRDASGTKISLRQAGACVSRNWLANWKHPLIYAPCIREKW
jgi:hypothetical protein